jgi:hypothetical protein
VTKQLGAERVGVLSQRFDPATGDLEISETAPIALVTGTDPGGPSLAPSGLTLRRAYRQSHDGRVFGFRDEFVSNDGAAHRVEVRYLQSAGSGANASTGYRIPWGTGEAYVPTVRGVTFGPSTALPATIYARVAPTQQDDVDLPGTGGVAAFAYDTPISTTTGAYPNSVLTQVVRDVPAAGSATVAQRLVHATTSAELDALLRASAPAPETPPVDPQPALPAVPVGNVPGPVLPTPTPPAAPLADPLGRLQTAARKVLRTRKQAFRLRARKTVAVALAAAPAGRYRVSVRRGSRTGASYAAGATTLRAAGRVTVKLRLTAAGRRWLATRAGRRARTVKTFVTVSWTPTGGKLRTRSSQYTMRVR